MVDKYTFTRLILSVQMNVTAGKNSLVNESAAKEMIRRHRFAFPKWKGSYTMLLKNEMPS